MKLIATIRNYGSRVKSNPYHLEVRLNGRPIFEKSYRTIKSCEEELKNFDGAEIVRDFNYKRENAALLKQYE